MRERETLGGRPVSDEEIEAWVLEAERGYDLAALRKKRGRPGRAREASQVVTVRLSPEELAELDSRANREGKSRSEMIRAALAESAR